MRTKVSNCGKYECAHCADSGYCMINSISIDQDGKCIMFRKSKYKITEPNPMDEHTNMC